MKTPGESIANAGLLLRPMVATDAAAAGAIEQLCYQHGWSEAIFSDCITQGVPHGYRCWSLDINGVMAGYLIF
ncbi:MAG: hypothetical protein HQL49_09575, partial [Gammaproteobacteria bacterium]|nr:hypothetical protein [Gammaproteobacteria bacterium]